MGLRPEFSIADLVGARRDFDDGRGPAEAWARLNALSLWRLDELAERAGSRTWAMLVAPPELPLSDRASSPLMRALRSAQVAAAVLPAFWRFREIGISNSRVVVAHQLAIPQALRLARRYGQSVVADAQRIPFEQVVIHDLTAERRIEVGVFEPTLIAQHVAQCAGAADVAVVYRCTTIAECLAMALAERRLREASSHHERLV